MADGPQPPTLSAQINDSTRKLHTELNRLIIARLPLALPPHTLDPALLGIGLVEFAHIFYAFEQTWDGLIEQWTQHTMPHADDPTPTPDRLNIFLSTLRPTHLPRAARLRADLRSISRRIRRRSFTATTAHCRSLARMQASIRARPHTLIAYAWVMYMATFSGGRWVRQQFVQAGGEYWTGVPENAQPTFGDGAFEKTELKDGRDRLDLAQAPEMGGYSFLFFEGDKDGEDIKAEFKRRLEAADELLSTTEKEEVLMAAYGLFEHCIDLVESIDEKVWWHEIMERTRPLRTLGLLFALAVLTWLSSVYFGALYN